MIDSHPTAIDDDEPGDMETARRMLRLAGPRAAPPGDRQARVRSRVHAHWKGGIRARAGRRRAAVWTGLLAAAAAVVLIVSRLDDNPAPAQLPPAAVWVAKVSGSPGAAQRAMSGGSARQLAVDEGLVVGETIETEAGRVALRFADGTSVRLDVSSRATLVGPRAVELSSGAVYIDTGTSARQLEIRTALGTVRDIGTQFEVRLLEKKLRLRVRTGAVELSDTRRSVTGHAGTEILFSATDAESRPLAPFGPDWRWTVEASPSIDIEGVPLAAYLDRLAREQGWTVQYVDSALARQAGGIILHGSVAGLAPEDALDVAVGTSGLAYRLDNGRLVVSRETSR